MTLHTIVVHDPGVVVTGGNCPVKTYLVKFGWFFISKDVVRKENNNIHIKHNHDNTGYTWVVH